MSTSLFEVNSVNGINKDILIITFGGNSLSAGGIPPFEFLNTLTSWFPNYDKKFIIDLQQSWYHKGIKDISTNIDETKTYLEELIKGYKKVIFLGISSGGYASILFGSLLNISDVIAFFPQTILRRDNIDLKYKNLKTVINNKTNYHLYGITSIKNIHDLHHISHVDNLKDFQNVKITYKYEILLKTMRDNGELKELLENIIM